MLHCSFLGCYSIRGPHLLRGISVCCSTLPRFGTAAAPRFSTVVAPDPYLATCMDPTLSNRCLWKTRGIHADHKPHRRCLHMTVRAVLVSCCLPLALLPALIETAVFRKCEKSRFFMRLPRLRPYLALNETMLVWALPFLSHTCSIATEDSA